MRSLLVLASLATIAVAATPSPTIAGGLPGSTSTVNSLDRLAKSQGKLYFGSATDNPELTDTPYVDILTSGMFGQTTPTNAMKWGPSNPAPNVFNYTGGDQIVELARQSRMIVRGHNLVWENQLPPFINSSLTNTELLDDLLEHIRSEVDHFRGQVRSWDVVNEPFNDSGGLREWQVPTAFGQNYLNIAFHAAHIHDPEAVLYINDYNLEFEGAKFDTAVQVITELVEQGVPIHGVGFEGHMIVGETPSAAQVASHMENFTRLGLEVAITELDVRMVLPETDALLEQQKLDYQNMVAGCMLVERCVGVTLWDFTDTFSWVPGAFAGQGGACPWDDELERKPAYDGIVLGILNGKPAPPF